MRTPITTPALALLALAATTAAPGLAQPAGVPTATPVDAPIDERTAGLQLGERARAAQAERTVLPHVVIVPDADSYLAAISTWGQSDDGTPAPLFPVLIDDGTDHATETIARFVRAFHPASVLGWALEEAPPASDPEARLRTVHGDATAALATRSPGLVLIDPEDDAWAGGLALAAARGQHLGFIDARSRVNGAMSTDDAQTLLNRVLQAAAETGVSWQTLGDDLDAITLAFNDAGRIQTNDKPREFLALTDLAGRMPDGTRWGYAAQLIGDGPDSAARAMASLFLPASAAWVFDGYPDREPWSRWDGTTAAQTLDGAGISTRVIDVPSNGIDNWRATAANGVLPVADETGAGMVFINSKGRPSDFELEPGMGRAGDVPWLDVPAAVHMVHSFSAQSPGSDSTIAGRFFANGAFLYVGSVHEPGLGGFVETPEVARRLVAGEPIASAVRVTGRPPWRITVLGDPLWTYGNAFERAPDDQTPPLPGLVNLAEVTRERFQGGNFAGGLRGLIMLGNDTDAVRLASGLLNDRPAGIDPAIATLSMGPLVREGSGFDALRMYAKLNNQQRADRRVRDLAWHAGRSVLQRGPDGATLAALRVSLREGQLADDGMEVAAWIARDQSREAAAGFLRMVRDQLPERDRRRRALERELSRLGG